MSMVITDKSFLKKHVDLILCSNSMTLVQRKIFNLFLYNALPEITEKTWFTLPLKDVCKIIGYTSRNYVPLVDAIKGLTSLSVTWRVIDSKTKLDDIISDSIAIMSRVRIEDGICLYKYNEEIKQKLAHPGIYGKINLISQSKMSSTFGLVLYELCEKYKNVKMTPWISMEDLRLLMGVKEKSYRLFADFERYVLKKASQEVKNNSNFIVSYDKKREKRAVKYIKFIIEQNNNISLEYKAQNKILDKSAEQDQGNGKTFSATQEVIIRSRLTNEFKVSPSIADKLIYKYGLKLIDDRMNALATLESYKSGQINNVAGALVDRIQNPDKYVEPMKSKEQTHHLSREHIAKLAAPGETWEQAERRLRAKMHRDKEYE